MTVAGILGDLAESAIKRGANVKDAASILPGHGGFLDRLDSLLFAAPILYYFALYYFVRFNG
jgi:phosphatidate cytidylyltransferase